MGTVTAGGVATQTVAGTITSVAASGSRTIVVSTGTQTVAGTVTKVVSTGTQTVVGTVTIAATGTQTVTGTVTVTGSLTDEAAVTQGTTQFQLTGGYYADSATAIASGAGAIVRITQYRGMHVNLRNSSGIEVPTQTTVAGTEYGLVVREARTGQTTMANSIPITIASNQPGSFSKKIRLTQALCMELTFLG